MSLETTEIACVSLLCSGQNKVPGVLHINGVMPVRNKLYDPGCKNRQVVKLICFMNMKGKGFIKEISGTKYTGMKALKEYTRWEYTHDKTLRDPETGRRMKEKVKMQGIGTEEFKDAVMDAMGHYMKQDDFRRRVGRERATILHDGFCMKDVKDGQLQLPQGTTIRAIKQPPRSCDFQPMDFSYFGAAKSKLRMELEEKPIAFPMQVKRLKQLLHEQFANVKPMQQIKRRLQLCVEHDGAFVEQWRGELKNRSGATG